MAKLINWAVEKKYGVASQIKRNMIVVGATPPEIEEYETLEEVLENIIDEEVPYQGTKQLHEVIPTLEAFQQYIADNNLTIDPNQTLEQLKAAAIAYFQIPEWEIGKAYQIDDEFRYNNQLYKVLQAHTSQADWLPDQVPALYLLQAAGGTIPDWVQPTGAHDAYSIGDEVMFEGTHYVSLIDNNTWSPTDYPQGWDVVT